MNPLNFFFKFVSFLVGLNLAYVGLNLAHTKYCVYFVSFACFGVGLNLASCSLSVSLITTSFWLYLASVPVESPQLFFKFLSFLVGLNLAYVGLNLAHTKYKVYFASLHTSTSWLMKIRPGK